MQEIDTAEEPRSKTFAYLFAKHAAISNSGGSPLDPCDLDWFLVRLPSCYYDAYLDSPPSAASISALTRLGVSRWPLVKKRIVNEVASLLAARRERGLATVRQSHYLRAWEHSRPWSVRFEDVSTELRRLREGRLKREEVCDVPTTASLQSNYNRELSCAPIARTKLPNSDYRTEARFLTSKKSSTTPLPLLVIINSSLVPTTLGTQATNLPSFDRLPGRGTDASSRGAGREA
jgi:hypothetical protein